mgnify:CR=1 FL=1
MKRSPHTTIAALSAREQSCLLDSRYAHLVPLHVTRRGPLGVTSCYFSRTDIDTYTPMSSVVGQEDLIRSVDTHWCRRRLTDVTLRHTDPTGRLVLISFNAGV